MTRMESCFLFSLYKHPISSNMEENIISCKCFSHANCFVTGSLCTRALCPLLILSSATICAQLLVSKIDYQLLYKPFKSSEINHDMWLQNTPTSSSCGKRTVNVLSTLRCSTMDLMSISSKFSIDLLRITRSLVIESTCTQY